MTTAEATIPSIADPVLLNPAIESVEGALGMCSLRARCVGVSSVPTSDSGNITGMIGVHGSVSGFITLNLGEQAAMSIVGGMLMDKIDVLNSAVIDGAGEVTNIIAGGIKSSLSGTPWAFRQLTVPSVVIGQNYQITYAAGVHYLAISFEIKDIDALMLEDRTIKLTLSLLRL